MITASKRESHARGFEVVRDGFGIVQDSQPTFRRIGNRLRASFRRTFDVMSVATATV
jgi:hypothetical protein